MLRNLNHILLIKYLICWVFRVKAIESHATDDDTKWLMYWCVYAFFGILEFFSDQLLFWIPLYTLSKVINFFLIEKLFNYLFKCLFLLWLMVPGKNGGTYIVYYKLIRPFVLKHQDRIETATDKIKDNFGKITKDLLSEKQQ